MDIVYEDDDLIVCQKPAGVLSQSAPGKKGKDMPALLAAHYAAHGEAITPYVVHRLDRGTAGLMVYAKHARAAAALSSSLVDSTLQKIYYAVVEGIPEPPLGEMQDLLFFDRVKDKTYVVRRPRRGVKEARLSYAVEKSIEQPTGPLSLVKIHLYTGRTHQIRAQFAARHLPLCGDIRYGAKTRLPFSLFSACLAFPHPTTGSPLAFTVLPTGEVFSLFL